MLSTQKTYYIYIDFMKSKDFSSDFIKSKDLRINVDQFP